MKAPAVRLACVLFAACAEKGPAPADDPAPTAGSGGAHTMTPAGGGGSSSSSGGAAGSSGMAAAAAGLPGNLPCDDPSQPEPPLVGSVFTPTDEDFLNPERGFHDDEPLPASALSDYRAGGHSWIRSYVVLGDYRASDLPAEFLQQLDYSFELVRDAGVKVILRFAYNDDGGEDAPLDRVQAHLAALAPILGKHADVIALLQAGFIGRWGEWHHSEHGLNTFENRATIMAGLLAAVPTERMVQLRYPWHRKQLYPELLTPESAFTGQAAARVGHHNDCFVTSNNDLGTYGDFWDDGEGSAPQDQVERWMDYTAQESRYVVVGGETCDNTERSGCATATAELARFHYSYLNSRFHAEVNQRWIDEGCMPEIRRRLGYRLELQRATISERVAPGGLLSLSLVLKNVGYAAGYNPRPVRLVLDGPTRVEAELPVDWRTWLPESGEVTVAALLRVPATLAPGTYRVALWMPDAAPGLAARAEYSVRFANAGVWNDALGDNTLASVVVDPAAPGCVDPTATAFSVVAP